METNGMDATDNNQAQLLRRVISMDALVRGRCSIPRSQRNIGEKASNFSRSSSLGRYGSKHASLEDGILPPSNDDPLFSSPCRSGRERSVEATTERTESRTWLVGRVSLMLLLFVTFSDLAFKGVNTQLHRIESHDDYDALSPDVIRPAFLYKTTSSDNHHNKPTIGLGSAAISRITDALGPILPFTGGVDLRRSEYYGSGNLLESFNNLVKQTYEAYANAKESYDTTNDDNDNKENSTTKPVPKKEKRKQTSILGASKSFTPLNNIAELTLEDIGTIFDFATSNNQEGFNSGKFLKTTLPRVRSVIQSIETAVAQSRGKGVKVGKIASKGASSGEVDAFLFCAAMRVFAEWRILRQVPEGYKGYAVGISLGQKDVVGNVVKIEKAAQSWIDHHFSESGAEVSSPTLRDVLEYEILLNEHPSLPRLKESSGAMGLLWVRRQLHYQTAIFKNILGVPAEYPTSKDAVSAAYTEVYENYHGWAVQKIFSYSFQASPDVEVIYKFMNPHRLKEVKEAARHLKPASVESEVSDELSSQLEEEEEDDAKPPSKIFNRIGWEWDRFANHIVQQFDKKSKAKKQQVRGSTTGLVGDELEEYLCEEMSRNALEHIISYLHVAKPLLEDLAALFDELNMDDPTKV